MFVSVWFLRQRLIKMCRLLPFTLFYENRAFEHIQLAIVQSVVA